MLISIKLPGQPADTLTTERDTLRDCKQQEVRDFFSKDGKKKRTPRKTMLLLLPNVSFNPVNGFLLGAAGTSGFYLGNRESTRVSSIGFNAAYTTKNQFLAFVKSNIYTNGDNFFLQGDWRFFDYNAYTWGLGTNAPDSIQSDNTLIWQGAQIENLDDGYPMDFNYLKFHEILNYKLARYNYIGIGYMLDHYYGIRDNALQLEEQPFGLTPHYLYSKTHGFDTSGYTLSGLSLSYVYDSRDNLINAYEGYFVNLVYRNNPEFLGSSAPSSSLWLEFRTYVGLSEKTPRHLLAFWFFSNLQISGRQPYLTLMATGEDQRARSGRGYIAGRYRGENFLYGEVEYRFPISQCTKILGGVLFVNVTSASGERGDVSLMDYFRPGAGFGLRIMLNKQFRTNINIDFGIGTNSRGFYFSGTETF